jgi:hypothetical protein
MRQFNGVSIIYTSLWSQPDEIFSTDACLTGCGGVFNHKIFHAQFPPEALCAFPSIHHLECLAILVAVRLWCISWNGLRIRVYCDNASVVQMINSGKTKDLIMGQFLRNIWLCTSLYEFELCAVHLPGVENRLADSLSRWHLDPTLYATIFNEHCSPTTSYQTEVIGDDMFHLNKCL